MKFDVDLSELDAADRQAFYDLATITACEAAAQTERERTLLGQINHDPRRVVDGLGPRTMGLHPFDRFAQPLLQGADQHDPEFWEWFLKTDQGDYARQRGAQRRIMIGYTGTRDPSKVKFHKSYGDGSGKSDP